MQEALSPAPRGASGWHAHYWACINGCSLGDLWGKLWRLHLELSIHVIIIRVSGA